MGLEALFADRATIPRAMGALLKFLPVPLMVATPD
jgi:hypothetical protein